MCFAFVPHVIFNNKIGTWGFRKSRKVRIQEIRRRITVIERAGQHNRTESCREILIFFPKRRVYKGIFRMKQVQYSI